ncbi:MAG: hypothetical protein AABZ06_00360, partial [Bdellovibrionota bacterium]
MTWKLGRLRGCMYRKYLLHDSLSNNIETTLFSRTRGIWQNLLRSETIPARHSHEWEFLADLVELCRLFYYGPGQSPAATPAARVCAQGQAGRSRWADALLSVRQTHRESC